MFTFFTM